MPTAVAIGCVLALFVSLENPTFAICFSIIYGAGLVSVAILKIQQTGHKDQTDESDENH